LIVFAAIAPHGNPVFLQPDGETRRGMDELRRRFEEAHPEAVILVTPHGTYVDGHVSVIRAARLSEHPSSFVEGEWLYTGAGAPELADACIAGLRDAGLDAVGLTWGATVAGASTMPIDWGAGIPLTFLSAPAAVVTPPRTLANEALVRAGKALAQASGERRVAFVASADHGHGHTHDGPYGFAPESQPYDERIVELVRENRLGELVAMDPQWAVDAKADSFCQLLMLHGALDDGFDVELLTYEVPTYFGMLTAAYSPR
jgi:aromatic ring-opening dioxygenase LigB subunit